MGRWKSDQWVPAKWATASVGTPTLKSLEREILESELAVCADPNKRTDVKVNNRMIGFASFRNDC